VGESRAVKVSKPLPDRCRNVPDRFHTSASRYGFIASSTLQISPAPPVLLFAVTQILLKVLFQTGLCFA
jgi:hypothetical protein